MNNKNYLGGIAMLIAVIALGVAMFKTPIAPLGGLSHMQKESFIQGLFGGTNRQLDISNDGELTVGTNGTQFAGVKTGSCTIWTSSQTIAATSTQQIECQGATDGTISAITGITTDSVCSLAMASSTNTTVGSIALGGASASSTAGTIVGRLINLTGTTFTWTAAASSSDKWKYICFDPA